MTTLAIVVALGVGFLVGFVVGVNGTLLYVFRLRDAVAKGERVP